jgi:D-serine dehydratase
MKNAPPPALAHALKQRTPLLWLNDNWSPLINVGDRAFGIADVREAERRLDRFAPLMAALFPELATSAGIVESELRFAPALKTSLLGNGAPGRIFVKCDHALPVAGSIKARGGVYEVLCHAEDLAVADGLLQRNDDIRLLASGRVRARFSRHEISVASTGNLGLSIGIMASTLGFRTVVHMSAEAKPWKRERLRRRGVDVIEHEGDFSAAVAAGRARASVRPDAHFVDDERSATLFFGYSVAALRLRQQLHELGVSVDAAHPLLVYLPCGVGGAPGGITFGLRRLLGDHVHCFFAEPVEAPSMLVRLALANDRPISVRDIGLQNQTEADGLAVARASDFVAPLMRPLASGVFTVADEMLFEDLYRLERTQALRVEPSAAAAVRGPEWLLKSDAGAEYTKRHALPVGESTHVIWTTGGSLLPENEYRGFYERGKSLS